MSGCGAELHLQGRLHYTRTRTPRVPPPPTPETTGAPRENRAPTRKLSGRQLCSSRRGQKRPGLGAALAFVPGSPNWCGVCLAALLPQGGWGWGDSVGREFEGRTEKPISTQSVCVECNAHEQRAWSGRGRNPTCLSNSPSGSGSQSGLHPAESALGGG